ncbi:MAG: hypothetical protein ACW967_01400 [Candidatus Hodarchaeales archaeon]
MSYESLSKRFPLFSLKEFFLESLELTSENIISFSQNWEMHKQQLLSEFPLNRAFYNFILEIRESLPYEENNVYHTLLGHVLYLTGNLTDLKRMIVPSEALLVLYQSLANFYLGQFQRAKDLSRTLQVILDHSNINLVCFIYSIKLYFDSYYLSESELKESSNALKNIIDTYEDKPSELERNFYFLAKYLLLNYITPTEDDLNFLKKNINKLDYWSAGICLIQLAKFYIRENDQENALKVINDAIRINENLPDNPDRFTPYLLLYEEFGQDLLRFEDKLSQLIPTYIEYLVKKKRFNSLNSEEMEKLENFKQIKTSFPIYFRNLLN